jgi:RNA polymerase sigma-70 factor, ECF subfamily
VRLDNAALDRAEATWTQEFLRGGDGFDFAEALRNCLGLLEPKQREMLDLRYVHRASRAEMAARGEMTENGIKSFLRRIRSLLADCVRRRLGTEASR